VAQEKNGHGGIFLCDESNQGFQVQGHGFAGTPSAPYRCIAKAALVIGIYRDPVLGKILRRIFDEIGIIVEPVHCDEDEPGVIHAATGQPSPQVQLGSVKRDKGCRFQLRLSQGRAVRGCELWGTGREQDQTVEQGGRKK